MTARSRLARTSRKPTNNLTAYDYLLRGEWHIRTDFGDADALKMFEKAVETDPRCARAYARMAVLTLYNLFDQGASFEHASRRAKDLLERALGIDDDDPSIQAIAALGHLIMGQHDRAKIHAERATADNPNDVGAIVNHGIVSTYLGDHLGGLEWYEKGRRLDPHEPEVFVENWLEVHYMLGQYEEASEAFKRWRNPPSHMYAELAACYAQLGQMDKANKARVQFERLRPEGHDITKLVAAHLRMMARQEDRDHWIEGYRKAGFDV